MGRGKWINKKTATTFNLVYRPQNDPLIHDESAPDMVLAPVFNKKSKGKGLSDSASELGSDLAYRPQNDPPIHDESAPDLVRAPDVNKGSTGKGLSDLASKLGPGAQNIRDNEGEAANYGIYYDDTEYDYMQHMRELGQGSGEAVFVEAKTGQNKGKGKGKKRLSAVSLEESLRQLDLQNQSEDLLDKVILPSKNLQKLTYQAQQDIPDAIAGFQPDMDPRLREVLEALEDEAYVDEETDDIFQELTKDAEELDPNDFDESYDDYYEEDEGWESDHTAKPDKEYRGEEDDKVPDLVDTSNLAEKGPSGDWMEDFKKFKDDQKSGKKPRATGAPSEIQSSIWTTTTSGGRKKKRAGAMTNPSTYSMTSSALVRTEQLGILDARFEKLEKEYLADFDDMASVSAVSTASTVQGPMRQYFDSLLDEFNETYSMAGKRRVKRGKGKGGVQELDEIRKELGPARIRPTFI